MDRMIIIWIAAIVVFSVAEAITVQLVSIWFGIASIVCLILAAVGAEIWLQVTVFIVVSVLLLVFTRPIVKRLSKNSGAKTNADRVIGEVAVVLQSINNDCAEGQVSVLGQTWTARSQDGTNIPAGEKVIVQAIEGVKVIVSAPVTAHTE